MSTITELAKKIEQTAADMQTACTVSRSAEKSAGEVASGIWTRIVDERKHVAEESERLKAAIADTNRTSTARRMDEISLERLEAYTPTIHTEEKQLFQAQITESETALHDWIQSEKELRDLLDQMKKALEGFKPSQLHKGVDIIQARDNIESRKERFTKIENGIKELSE